MILSVQPEYLESGSASPGVCYFCHAARRPGEVVVDFHVQVDVATFDGTAIDGWLQACSSCMAEVGRAIGMIDAGAATQLAVERLSLIAERDDLAERLDNADAALDAMKVYRAQPRRAKADVDA